MTRSYDITELVVLEPKKCTKKKPNLPQDLPQEGPEEILVENDAEKIEKNN